VFMQQLCANQLDVPAGTVVYGQFLNSNGGIEADVTVTRDAEDAFRITSGAATRWKDLRWLRAQRERLGVHSEVVDNTEAEAVLGIMGPASRKLLQGLSTSDFSNHAFPFATSQHVEVAGVAVRATRVSFAGELSWELYVHNDAAKRLCAAITCAGKSLDLRPAGHLALDTCRMEKGFKHWGHDIGPQETPLQANLAFAVAWDKAPDFIGRDALLRERDAGVRQHLTLFAIDGAHPLLLHDEPIYRDGRLVSRTTSGARGFRTGLSLCFGYLPCDAHESLVTLYEGEYEIDVAGERFPLQPLPRAPYDPQGTRMRG
jgi:4-methylaminobutanoate oxidase (formaldehyde-forming)